MTLAELIAELRKLMASIAEYRKLKGDERTDEKRTEYEENFKRVKELDDEIHEAEELE